MNFEVNTKNVVQGTYLINAPLIKPSKLTAKENGGIGKELSDGWAINYAMGCMHGCRFCYVDGIWKRYGEQRIGKAATLPWGNYFFVPKNIDQAIEETDWKKWRGQEAMMSSTHDPYLPQLLPITRKILEKALPEGVKLCIQTRSPLVIKDFDIIEKYTDQVRVQVSITTLNSELSRQIESRVSPPESRFKIIEKAKDIGLNTGIIVAPLFPKVKIREDPIEDLEQIIKRLSKIKPDYIYGESLHTRGSNMIEIEKALGERPNLDGFDFSIGKAFYKLLRKYGLHGKWWPDK